MNTTTTLASSITLTLATVGGADVLNVPADFASIQAAIDAASAGDTVLVDDGTYNEAIDLLGKAITVESVNGPESTIIDGTGITTSLVRCVSDEGPDTVIRGIKLYRGVVGSDDLGAAIIAGGGMFINAASPTLEDMVFERCGSGFGGGLYAFRCGSTVTDSIFMRCSATANGGGAQVFYNDADTDLGVIFENCTFTENTAVTYGGGVYAIQGNHTFSNCTFTANGRVWFKPFARRTDYGGGFGWFAGNDATLTVVGCSVLDNTGKINGGGIWVRPGYDTIEIQDSVICDNDLPNIAGRYIDLGGNDVCDCLGDLNGDGIVNGADIANIIAFWGPCQTVDCAADINYDGVINGADLAQVLGAWGVCPSP